MLLRGRLIGLELFVQHGLYLGLHIKRPLIQNPDICSERGICRIKGDAIGKILIFREILFAPLPVARKKCIGGFSSVRFGCPCLVGVDNRNSHLDRVLKIFIMAVRYRIDLVFARKTS